ncbi:MAG: mevalonate kinase [Chloroflexi bacterium]|nr:mevalonate kinase [Chloroflexota bacterium]
MTTASAPGKVILFGEHAVVYGQPAIAAPVPQVRATAVITPAPHAGILLAAADFGQSVWWHKANPTHPLAAAVHALASQLTLAEQDQLLSHLTITVSSTIPVASGLGSGAAIAAALIRALALHLGRADLATPAAVSALTYEVERIHHGTPSGIDNTVVSYEQPVYFVRDLATAAPDFLERLHTTGLSDLPAPALEPFAVGQPITLLIGYTGVAAPTKESVGDVRRQWLADGAHFNRLFSACGRIAQQARHALAVGDTATLGRLMWDNHTLLQEMTVSSAELDALVVAARTAGALGAKLSGGGRGGNMIALVTAETSAAVRHALLTAGAHTVLEMVLGEAS